ncbi:MAG: L,D-transpeptidase [Akkermansia sp.]|nr:L,D-transpeptidase [Akkermansia sp.]
MNTFHKMMLAAAAASAALLSSCQVQTAISYGKDIPPRAVVRDGIVVTLHDQKLTLVRGGKKVKDYRVSTSKFGIGNTHGSRRTPTGIHAVSQKTGEGQPKGMVFKGCRPTGEVVPVDASGRDPVVTRVIQLAGLEPKNSSTHARRIYIHGTPEERKIGHPASYGCIRMKSDDVVDLYRRVGRGTAVAIEMCSQKTYLEAEEKQGVSRVVIPDSVVQKLPTDGLRFRPTTTYRSRHSRLVRRTSLRNRSVASRGKSTSKSSSGKRLASTKKSRRR